MPKPKLAAVPDAPTLPVTTAERLHLAEKRLADAADERRKTEAALRALEVSVDLAEDVADQQYVAHMQRLHELVALVDRLDRRILALREQVASEELQQARAASLNDRALAAQHSATIHALDEQLDVILQGDVLPMLRRRAELSQAAAALAANSLYALHGNLRAQDMMLTAVPRIAGLHSSTATAWAQVIAAITHLVDSNALRLMVQVEPRLGAAMTLAQASAMHRAEILHALGLPPDTPAAANEVPA